jgi:hypothetical protein
MPLTKNRLQSVGMKAEKPALRIIPFLAPGKVKKLDVSDKQIPHF